MVIQENRRICYCGLRDGPHEIDRGTVARHRNRCKERGVSFEAHAGKAVSNPMDLGTASMQGTCGKGDPEDPVPATNLTTTQTSAQQAYGLANGEAYGNSAMMVGVETTAVGPGGAYAAGHSSFASFGSVPVDPALLGLIPSTQLQGEQIRPSTTQGYTQTQQMPLIPVMQEQMDVNWDIDQFLEDFLLDPVAQNQCHNQAAVDHSNTQQPLSQPSTYVTGNYPSLSAQSLPPDSHISPLWGASVPQLAPSSVRKPLDPNIQLGSGKVVNTAPISSVSSPSSRITVPFNMPPHNGPTHCDEFRYALSQPKGIERRSTVSNPRIPQIVPVKIAGGRERATSTSMALGLPMMKDEKTNETFYWINGTWQNLRGSGSVKGSPVNDYQIE